MLQGNKIVVDFATMLQAGAGGLFRVQRRLVAQGY